MSLRDRLGGAWRPAKKDPDLDPRDSPSLERASPGLEAFFHDLPESRERALLDLGSSVAENFRIYEGLARWIRFADLLGKPLKDLALSKSLHGLRPPSGGGFDLVLLWNMLDLLAPEERESLVEHLDRITRRGARIYLMVDASETGYVQPLTFTILGQNRVRQVAVGNPRPLRSPLLPAEIERLLGRFEVSRAFTLRHGLREYVGEKEGDAIRRSVWIRR